MALALDYERSGSRGRSSVVEHNLAMVGVVSSSLIARSILKVSDFDKHLISSSFSNHFTPCFVLVSCYKLCWFRPMTRSMDGERYLKNGQAGITIIGMCPSVCGPFYDGNTIRIALGTKSAKVARVRRDELLEADDDYWIQLKLSLNLESAGERMDTSHAEKRYPVAKARALSACFRFRPMDQLADPSQIEDIVRRLLSLEQKAASNGSLNPEMIDAVMGGVEEPRVLVGEAVDIYQTEIAMPDPGEEISRTEAALKKHARPVLAVFHRGHRRSADCRDHSRARPAIL